MRSALICETPDAVGIFSANSGPMSAKNLLNSFAMPILQKLFLPLPPIDSLPTLLISP